MKNKKNWFVLALMCIFSFEVLASSIPEKSSISSISARDKTQNNSLSIDEFNQLLGTLRGVFNWYKNDKIQIGINDNTPDEDLTLDVGGKIGAEYFCDGEGKNCVKAGEWSTNPTSTSTDKKPTPLITKNEAANCKIRYRVKAGSFVGEWKETSGNTSPEGAWSVFNDTEKNVCENESCGIQIGIKCEDSSTNSSPTSCQARYRIFDANNTSTDNSWIETSVLEENNWTNGDWLEINNWKNLSWQTSLQCQSEDTTCRLSYKTRDEKNISDWITTGSTQNKVWTDGVPQSLKSERSRPCDGSLGCGVKFRMHCSLKDHAPKIPIYQCPLKSLGGCDSSCNGQLSSSGVCSFSKNKGEESCSESETLVCDPLGYLIR